MKKQKNTLESPALPPPIKKARPSSAAHAIAPWRPRWWHYALGFGLLLAAAFLLYGPALNGPFMFDDTNLPFMNPATANKPFREWVVVRPVLMATFWINYQLSGQQPYSYHWLNVFFHALNSVLAWLIVRKLLELVNTKGATRELLAVFSGVLFLVHPLQTESVAYIASRSETLSILFFLSAFVVFLYWRRDGISFPASISVLVLFGAAVLTKEHTVILPALLLLADYYFNPWFSVSGIRRNWKLYALILLGSVYAAYRIYVVLVRSDTAGFSLKDLPWYQYLFTQFRAIWVYIRMFVLPVGQNLDHEFQVSRTVFDYGSVVYLIGLLALAVLAWVYRKRYPLASFGFFGFLLLLAPTSSVVPVKDVLVEHRTYLPFVCLLLIVVDFLRQWRVSRSSLTVGMTTVLTIFSILAFQRNQLWGNPIEFWSDSARKSPHKARPRFQAAFARFTNGQCAEASQDYEAASKLEPIDYPLLIDWALADECAHNPGKALERLQQATRFQKSAHIYSLIGMMYGEMGKPAEALDALHQAETLDANYWMTYVYMGNVFASVGDRDKAILQYRRALAIEPWNQIAQASLDRIQQMPSR